MAPSQGTELYSPLQKWLHWAVVGLLLLQYLFFDGMGRPFHRLMETGTPSYTPTVVIHITIGVAVLVLAAWRLALRVNHGAPPPPESEPEFAKVAAKWTHVGLYVMLFALPLVGGAAWFKPSATLADLHAVGTNVLLGLAGLHVAGALVHQFWWRTGLLGRMI
ncbi:cytochrome b [Tropicimonas sp. IMCC34043]|uniref:cytochrome b n=1 Tax=Tropicimonas sp. IMCC34043 TaxID=2248760 RepID=UPI001300AE4A|nr:cytochrome b/b6 domain-containing protein [Tropicimonas sp. IMCC34043]